MERTRIHGAFGGSRGRSALNLKRLEEILVSFSQLVITEKRVKEIDINPFFVSGDMLIALDARVVLYEANIPDEKIPKAAIRPYPVEYSGKFKTKTGLSVKFRPIRADDEPLVVKFHKKLSDLSVERRYFANLNLDRRIAHERLLHVCFNDYDREIALVAEVQKKSEKIIIGIARLSRTPHTSEAEFSMIVADDYQNQGVGFELLSRMMDVTRQEGVRRVFAKIQAENLSMTRLFKKMHFKFTSDGHSEQNVIAEFLTEKKI